MGGVRWQYSDKSLQSLYLLSSVLQIPLMVCHAHTQHETLLPVSLCLGHCSITPTFRFHVDYMHSSSDAFQRRSNLWN